MSGEKKPIVLITSGTSKTGSEVAKQLLATGNYTVRVASRDPGKLSALCAHGAEAVLLDATSATASAAFTGVYAAFIVLPNLFCDLESVLFDNFMRAAKHTGVKHIVYLSAIDGDVNRKFSEHQRHEQLLIKSGLPFTILRPTSFHENSINFEGESIKKDGVIISSAGDGVFTSVAVQDIAAVAVAAFADPSKHSGQLYTLTTEAVTYRELAEKLSKALGKQITHVNVTPEEHLEILKHRYGATGKGAALAAVLVYLEQEKGENRWSEVDPALERVLGRKGISLDQFFADNATALI